LTVIVFQFKYGPKFRGSQFGLELAEGVLDGIEVRAVPRQVPQFGTGSFNRGFHRRPSFDDQTWQQ
jgi:hypothetical protein